MTACLDSLTQLARARGFSDSTWAARSGLPKETLSRLRRRTSCDFATLEALAAAVDARLDVVETKARTLSADGHGVEKVDRQYEERLVELCVSRTVERQRWLALGPPFFMAGVATMLASVRGFDRRGLLDLAESLYPGMSEPAVFTRWLDRSPLRPSRFLPLVEADAARAA